MVLNKTPEIRIFNNYVNYPVTPLQRNEICFEIKHPTKDMDRTYKYCAHKYCTHGLDSNQGISYIGNFRSKILVSKTKEENCNFEKIPIESFHCHNFPLNFTILFVHDQ